MVTGQTKKEKDYLTLIARKNNIRNSIKQKKRILSKMRNHPSMQDDYLRISDEIEDLEDELETI